MVPTKTLFGSFWETAPSKSLLWINQLVMCSSHTFEFSSSFASSSHLNSSIFFPRKRKERPASAHHLSSRWNLLLGFSLSWKSIFQFQSLQEGEPTTWMILVLFFSGLAPRATKGKCFIFPSSGRHQQMGNSICSFSAVSSLNVSGINGMLDRL